MKRMKHMMMKYVTQGKFKLMAGYNIFSDKKLGQVFPCQELGMQETVWEDLDPLQTVRPVVGVSVL